MNDIPVSSKQIRNLALIGFIPLALAVAVIFWAPPKAGQTASDAWLAAAIVGVIAIGLFGLIAVTAMRHSIDVTPAALVIRHSMYTLVMERSAVKSATVREIKSLDQLGLSTKKNGVAAFGYFSGWFRGTRGELTFCALSTWPAYLVTIEGDAKCRRIALSASPELARSIEAWASQAPA